MDDKRKLAFSFAQDVTKQLLSFSTAIIGLTVTFTKAFSTPSGSLDRGLLGLSWALLLLSIFFGIWTLLAMTGTLEPNEEQAPSIRGQNVTIPSLIQILLFIVGLGLTIAYGVVSTGDIQNPVSTSETFLVIETYGDVFCGELSSNKAASEGMTLTLQNGGTLQLDNVHQVLKVSSCP